jgi:ribosomal protein L37AE/L43A
MTLCEEVLTEVHRLQSPKTACSFCGKSYDAVHGRIANGPGVSICENCLVFFRKVSADPVRRVIRPTIG